MTDWGTNANAALARAHRALIRGWDAGLDMARQLVWAQEVAEEADALAEGQRERAERAERERDRIKKAVADHCKDCAGECGECELDIFDSGGMSHHD